MRSVGSLITLTLRSRRYCRDRGLPALALASPLLWFTVATTTPTSQAPERDPAELIALIRSNDSIASAEAITALSSIHPLPESAIEAIIDALADQRNAEPMPRVPRFYDHVPTVSTIAFQALIKIGPAIVRPLSKRLREPSNKELYQLMIRTLSAIGPAAREAIPDLERRFNDPEHDTRLAVLQALLEIEPHVAKLSPIMDRALRDGDPQVRSYAIRAAGNAGLAAATHSSQLVKLLNDPADRWNAISNHFFDTRPVRFDAAIALAEMGCAGRPALAKLQAMMHTDKDSAVRVAAAYAVIKLGGQASVANRLLINEAGGESQSARTQEEGSFAQQEAIFLLGRLGSKVNAAIPTLRQALAHRDGSVRTIATHAMAKIAPSNCEPWLLPMLSDADPIVRRAAIEALSETGCRSLRFGQALITALSDDDGVFGDDIRSAAAEALGNLGTQAYSATPTLNRLAESDESEFVQTTAREALQKIRQAVAASEASRNSDLMQSVVPCSSWRRCRSSTQGYPSIGPLPSTRSPRFRRPSRR